MSENTQEQQFDLTLQDLAAVKNIIDIASQRGAFKPNEMVAVGTIYNKLVSFLDAVSKQAAQSQPEGEAANG